MVKESIISDSHEWVKHFLHVNNRHESWPDIWVLWDDSTKKAFIREVLLVASMQEDPLSWFWESIAHVNHPDVKDFNLFMINPENEWIEVMIIKEELRSGSVFLKREKQNNNTFWEFYRMIAKGGKEMYLLHMAIDVFLMYSIVKMIFFILFRNPFIS